MTTQEHREALAKDIADMQWIARDLEEEQDTTAMAQLAYRLRDIGINIEYHVSAIYRQNNGKLTQ